MRLVLCLLLAFLAITSASAQAAKEGAAEAERLLRSGRIPEATQRIEQLLRLHSEDPSVLYVAGLAAFSAGEAVTAEQYLSRAAVLDPNAFPIRFLLAAILMDMQKDQQAIPHLEAAHQLEPGNPDVVKLLAVQYNQQLRSGDAARLLLPLIHRNPKDEELRLLLLEAYHKSGDREAALEAARHAVEALPDSGRIAGWLGFQLAQSGDFAAAEPQLLRAIQLEPDDHLAYYVLADIRLKQERHREAEALFQASLKRNPEHGEAMAGLARAVAAEGRLPDAIALLEKAARLMPQNPSVALELSRLYMRAGQEEKAGAAAAEFRRRKEQAEMRESPSPR